jgi:hypothetical protein
VISITDGGNAVVYVSSHRKGSDGMTSTSWNGKRLALIVAAVTFASGAAYASLASMQPETFSNDTLGDQWQCSTTAGIFTTCSPVHHAQPAVQSSRKAPLCLPTDVTAGQGA